MSTARKKGEGTAPGIPMEQPLRLAVRTTRDQQLCAVNTVCAFVPAGVERDFVLEALFRPPYRTPPTNVSRTHESVVRFDQAARDADRAEAIASQAKAAGGAFDRREAEIEALRRQHGVTGVQR